MSFRRNIYSAMLVAFGTALGSQVHAQPVYENNTPTGFSVSDSTGTVSFVKDKEVTVQVDLNQSANFDFPVIGNFQKLERSKPFFTTPGTAAYMHQALEIDASGIIHRAWIQQRGVVSNIRPTSTPVYGVVYAKSLDGGATFLDTVSVSGSLRFDMTTTNFSMTSGFSTLDLVVDSKGNPRVVYAMNTSADGVFGTTSSRIDGRGVTSGLLRNIQSHNNIFFNYSNDGGSSWLPANNAVVINDTTTIGANTGVVGNYVGRNTAFPRMAITSIDDIFIVYQRSINGGAITQDVVGLYAHKPDIMLAKMAADSLKLGSAQAVRIGATGTVGSFGGIRLDPDNGYDVTPDIAVGDNDILHVVWFNPVSDQIQHKQMPADDWDDRSAFGWNQAVAGKAVGTFDDDRISNFGIHQFVAVAADIPGDDRVSDDASGRIHLFPTVVVDKSRSPDRVYTFWKHTDETVTSPAGTGTDENIAYAISNYNGQPGIGATWGTTTFAFPAGTGYQSGSTLFQAGTTYNVESHWQYVDRVAVVVDPRKNNGADIHIAFSGGVSVSDNNLMDRNQNNIPPSTSIYYSRFNGNEWELPQVVASQSNGSPDGFLPATVTSLRAHSAVFAPDIAMRSGDDNVYLSFVGGSPTLGGVDLLGNIVQAQSGRGLGSGGQANIAPLPYFKVLGRVVAFDDVSIPTGAFVYRMSYDPVLPQTITGGSTALTKNIVSVLAGGNTDGSGIGAGTPGASAAPGGFLSGQWMRINSTSLGVASLVPGTAGATFKGAISQTQASNDNGVWEGQIDDDGANGFAEWGDDGDRANLLLKLNVLGSDSSSNLFVVANNSAAVATTGGLSQNLSLAGVATAFSSIPTPPASIVQGRTYNRARSLLTQGLNPVSRAAGNAVRPPMGSYFLLGANISIVADNKVPIVNVTSPDATTATTGFSNQTFSIRYVLFDEDDDVGTTTLPVAPDTLKTELYYYPDNGLSSVRDIRTFGVLIVDENDAFTTAATNPGTGDFSESSSASNVQVYSWDDPGVTLQNAFGWAPITKVLDGTFYIYAVADDGSNPPVFGVSAGPLRIRHIPLASSVAPVSVDTVDTGEFDDLDKTNPYQIKFQLIDYDDNAQVRLFFSTVASLSATDVNYPFPGIFPNLDIQLAGATPIQLSDTLRTDEDTEFTFDVTAQGSTQDSIIAQGNYTIYAVVADGDSFAVGVSGFALAVRHSPAFEFTAPLAGTVKKINTSQQFNYTVEWQRGRSDQDLDGNATITLYYTGVDPTTFNYAGTDSTRLLATSGANAGSAILIQGGIREDDEGAGDQFVWDFKNPPNELPKVYRQKYVAANDPTYSIHKYQHGATTDTAWVYAVLADTLGNTRVAAGGAVLLLGSQETPASQTPRVTMLTPPSGDQLLVNGDVVKLEWDAFLIDDNTGTDDAYLRLYAAPKGKYKTLSELESNVLGDGGSKDVIIINSLTGSDTTVAHVTTLRESSPRFFNWDTKTTSFGITGTPTEFDIFIGASMDPFRTHSAVPVYVNGQIDSIASGLGSKAQKAVLSKAPGVLRVEGTDPIFSMELSPGSLTASTGDTLNLQVLTNSQGSSIDQMGLFLNVPRNYFDVVDLDPGTAGMQPFADSTGAFQTASTIAQNDTTAGTAQWIKLNFVESVILREVIGRVAAPFDSSQVAASLQLVVKNYSGGAPLDTLLQWSVQSGRKTAFRRGTTELAQPARDATVILTPRARLIVTVPLEGRSDYADTMDAHLRLIGATQDITDQDYIFANDVALAFTGGGTATFEDSVQVVTDAFGTFQLRQIPPGIYEITVKAPGYVTGRSDTLTLFNGLSQAIEPTFGSDALGNLSPATPLGNLRGGDATNDNQVDISDANLIFSIWNLTPADVGFVRDADVNNDGVINSIDLGFVTKNFGNDGFGAPPVFRSINEGGDNSAAIARMEGIEDVEAWWPGRVFEVTAKVEGMSDVAAYGLRISYDPEKVKPLAAAQAVSQGDVFDGNAAGSLFFNRVQPGIIEVASGRIGADWSASGDAELVSIRFVALDDDPGVIDIISGEVVNSAHIGIPVRVDKAQALPMVAALHQNYPNPFNPSTEIRFDIPTARDVKLRIYNQLGQTVRTLVDNRMKAGTYSFEWDGSNQTGHGVASGVYFYNLEAGDFRDLRKMTLVK